MIIVSGNSIVEFKKEIGLIFINYAIGIQNFLQLFHFLGIDNTIFQQFFL